MKTMTSSSGVVAIIICILIFHTTVAVADGGCESEESKSGSLRLKVAAIFSILFASGVGVLLPILGKSIPALRPEANLFFMVKAFAAGVILATGFIHVLPDAFEKLTSSCLSESPWQDFPFAGFAAMMGAIGTLMVDCFATTYFGRLRSKAVAADEVAKMDVEGDGDRGGQVAHTHATHGHTHGPLSSSDVPGATELIRNRVISQVLELGIVVHSVIIGIALGTSGSASTIRPLIAALSFHQFFEGMGLGGCIVQARFHLKSIVVMVLFFSLTTPVGIATGIGIASVYNESSPTALIVEGLLDSVAAGILIYMALVDLLAADFMNPKVQCNGKLQLGVNLFLLLGAGLMSLIAKWA